MTWFDGVTATFLYKTVPKSTQKGKSSLYNVSVLKTEDDTWWRWGGKKKEKDGIVLFFVSGSDELDVVCVKASEFMHTRKHTHIIHRLDPQSVQSVPGRWSERALNLTCFVCLLPLNLPTSTQWFPTFHRMTWQHPENLLGLVFHFCKRWTDQNRESKRFQIEKKIKIAPFTMDLKVGWPQLPV